MDSSLWSSFLTYWKKVPFEHNQQVVFAIFFFCFGLPAAALPIITVPRSTSELCATVSWGEIVIFILANYVTHAVTVRTYPGEKKTETALWMVAALLWPYVGAYKGLHAIYTWARSAPDSLQVALRAHALCVVARNHDDENSKDHWAPDGPYHVDVPAEMTTKLHGCDYRIPDSLKIGDDHPVMVKIEGDVYNQRINPKITKVHGQFKLPKGYHLHRLIENVSVEKEWEKEDIELASSLSTPKVIASLIQICASVATLYRARGTQLKTFGWAAFGLTVIPYAIMSIVNLLGNLVSPEYSAIYMVRSDVMEEAISRGGIFVGTVGKIRSTPSKDMIPCEDVGEQSIFLKVDSRRNSRAPENSKYPIEQSEEIGEEVELVERNPQGDFRTPTQCDVVRVNSRIDKQLDSEPLENLPTFKHDRGSSSTIHLPARGLRYEVPNRHRKLWFCAIFFILSVIVAMPYAIIFILTDYHHGTSTRIERTFFEYWLIIGQVAGLILFFYIFGSHNFYPTNRYFGLIALAILGGAPSIGGFVMVIREIKQSQLCVIL